MKQFFSFLFFSLLLCSNTMMSQNTGINTKNPGSILTVNGSFAADYKIVTQNTTLGISDYYVAYNGNSSGEITLPALINGSGNYKGRIYGIKNTSNSQLTIVPSGTEKIDGLTDISSVIVPPGYYVELISKGTTAGSTWELSMLAYVTIASTMNQLVNISVATPQGAIATSAFSVNNSAYTIIPGSSSSFTLPVARPVFLNLTLGLDELAATSTTPPYFRCELYIDGTPTGLFQIVQQIGTGYQLQFNMSGVRSLSAGTHTIDTRITRWHNNGVSSSTNQSFGILSLVVDAVYMD
ncbi:hypothetical protein [Flavobacterium lindanitolerans]|uniref:hypothetical protein n=1 Tax=Flavobacterium lindanitolerans TaxID=428988 RepID=UPI0031DB125D